MAFRNTLCVMRAHVIICKRVQIFTTMDFVGIFLDMLTTTQKMLNVLTLTGFISNTIS